MKFITGLLLLASPLMAGGVRLECVATIPSVGTVAEIVKYHPATGLILATDSGRSAVDAYRVVSLNPPGLVPIDGNTNAPGFQGLEVPGEPTSIAIRPDAAFALITIKLDGGRAGQVWAVELTTNGFGAVTHKIEVGYGPDSIAISPDGRWAIVANEAEGDDTTPGGISAIYLKDTSVRPVNGLTKLLAVPPGQIEPEFVAMDSRSRFAVVSLQENHAFAIVDLQQDPPVVVQVVDISPGVEPDGIAVMDGLVALAEEKSESVSFYSLNPDALTEPAVFQSRRDVRLLVDPSEPAKKRSPESVLLLKLGDVPFAVVGTEKGDRLLALDISNPAEPVLSAQTRVGDRPEGLIAVADGDGYVLITGEEGKSGGSISFSRFQFER